MNDKEIISYFKKHSHEVSMYLQTNIANIIPNEKELNLLEKINRGEIQDWNDIYEKYKENKLILFEISLSKATPKDIRQKIIYDVLKKNQPDETDRAIIILLAKKNQISKENLSRMYFQDELFRDEFIKSLIIYDIDESYVEDLIILELDAIKKRCNYETLFNHIKNEKIAENLLDYYKNLEKEKEIVATLLINNPNMSKEFKSKLFQLDMDISKIKTPISKEIENEIYNVMTDTILNVDYMDDSSHNASEYLINMILTENITPAQEIDLYCKIYNKSEHNTLLMYLVNNTKNENLLNIIYKEIKNNPNKNKGLETFYYCNPNLPKEIMKQKLKELEKIDIDIFETYHDELINISQQIPLTENIYKKLFDTGCNNRKIQDSGAVFSPYSSSIFT